MNTKSYHHFDDEHDETDFLLADLVGVFVAMLIVVFVASFAYGCLCALAWLLGEQIGTGLSWLLNHPQWFFGL